MAAAEVLVATSPISPGTVQNSSQQARAVATTSYNAILVGECDKFEEPRFCRCIAQPHAADFFGSSEYSTSLTPWTLGLTLNQIDFSETP